MNTAAAPPAVEKLQGMENKSFRDDLSPLEEQYLSSKLYKEKEDGFPGYVAAT